MVTKSITDIKKAVRIILDENENVDNLLTVQDVDTLQTDAIIEQMIAVAIDMVYASVPLSMIADATSLLNSTTNTWDNTDPYCSKLKLDENVMKVVSVRGNTWTKNVSSFIYDYQDEYLELRSAYPGVRASNDRPRAAIVYDLATGKNVIEAYPQFTSGYARGILKASASNGNYNMASSCYSAILYVIAHLYYVTLNEPKRAEMMEAEAIKLLGVESLKKQMEDVGQG